jgi:chaperonin GroES
MVKVTEEDKTSPGGIVLPDSAEEKPFRGTVIAVGPGEVRDNGVEVKPEVDVGDRVIFAKYAGTEITDAGEEYLIMNATDIYAREA